jgi:hypothetical protein
MNILIKYKKIHKYESVWRNNIKINKCDLDHNNIPFPFPIKKKKSKINKKFISKLKKIENILISEKKYKKYKKPKNCLITNKKNITKKLFNLLNNHWEDSLIYYIKNFKITPSKEFIKLINNFYYDKNNKFNFIKKIKTKSFKINSISFVRGEKKSIKITHNQLRIIDALMNEGGIVKKYKYGKHFVYSEHSGLLDFKNSSLQKIIVNTKKNRIDSLDKEIYMPNNMIEAYDFEYMFHTHPPTPKPGGRAKDGILYEFPSTSDIFHFIEHYNNGVTQGSIIVAPEGLYIIKPYGLKSPDEQIFIKDEYKTESIIDNVMNNIQDLAINKYGTNFKINYFYSNIAQDKTFIKKLNNILKKYNIIINYKSRKKINNRWIIGDIILDLYPIEPK